MQDDHEGELTREELERLRALHANASPPPGLEERVVGELRGRGLIRARRAWGRLAAIAAAFVLAVPASYLYGVQVGARQVAEAPPQQGANFALMVLDPVGADWPAAQVDAVVAEAARWAEGLAEDGVLFAAEKLREEGARLVEREGVVQLAADFPDAGEAFVLGGFFMIRAADYQEAQRIAATCPLLRWGSTIEVRAFDEP